MNKKEAINKLKKHRVGFGGNAAVRFDRVVSVINQINEPAKVVVPKYISDKIEYCKDAEGYGLFHAMDYCYQYKDSVDWLESNEELFARAWLDGYEVKKERLYTVEIPDPNSYCDYRYLSRNDKGICLDASNNTKWKQKKRNQFTESEIKQDFEWAWDAGFAEPVEAKEVK